MFNSNEYAWKDIKVALGGRTVTGITQITYDTTQDVNNIYASGDEPHSQTTGNRDVEGTIGLLQSEVDALNRAAKAAGGRNLLDLTLDVTIAYARTLGEEIVVDTVRNARATSLPKGGNQNDPNMISEITFRAMKVDYDV